jgi:L-lactate permease
MINDFIFVIIDFTCEFGIINQEDLTMKLKNTAQTILSGLVFIIGFYMIIKFAGTALPPVLSGIAFMIIGFLFLLKR